MLNDTELSILKADALTFPAIANAISVGDDAAIRDHFNSVTTEFAWRTSIEPEEYLDVMDWTEIDALSNGRARIWEWITSNQTRFLNSSKGNIRAGLANAFQGPSAANTRAALLSIASRLMTRAELLLVDSTAGGTGTQVDAKTMTFQGLITLSSASLIRAQGD